VIGSAPKLHLVIELMNNGETAIFPKLVISWLRKFCFHFAWISFSIFRVEMTSCCIIGRSLVNTPSDCGQEITHSTFTLSCSLGQTLERGQRKVLELEFDMSDMMAGEQNALKELVVNIHATTTSDLLKPIIVSPLILPITASAKISVLATVKTMNITTLNPYNVFTHSYLVRLIFYANPFLSVVSLILIICNFLIQLTLDGPSTLKTTELQFDFPESLIRTQHDRLVVNITHIEVY